MKMLYVKAKKKIERRRLLKKINIEVCFKFSSNLSFSTSLNDDIDS